MEKSRYRYYWKDRISRALEGDQNALKEFESLGGDRDVCVNINKETTWEELTKDYHFYAVQWRAAKFLCSPMMKFAAKMGMIYLGRLTAEKFQSPLPKKAIFTTESEVLNYMKNFLNELTPSFQEEYFGEDDDDDVDEGDDLTHEGDGSTDEGDADDSGDEVHPSTSRKVERESDDSGEEKPKKKSLKKQGTPKKHYRKRKCADDSGDEVHPSTSRKVELEERESDNSGEEKPKKKSLKKQGTLKKHYRKRKCPVSKPCYKPKPAPPQHPRQK